MGHRCFWEEHSDGRKEQMISSCPEFLDFKLFGETVLVAKTMFGLCLLGGSKVILMVSISSSVPLGQT